MNIEELIAQGKIKRYLTARHRIVYPGGIYHVTHRAPGREVLFVENKDYLHMLSLLKEISGEFKWRLFSFVLMPNHLHLLLRISEVNLSEGIKKLCERYAKYFNKKYERKGPVFSRPYRAALCLDDNYLLSISIYIHLNPFKVKLCKKIDDYRWSSLRLYIGEGKSSFIDQTFVLRILSSDKIAKAKQMYRELISKAVDIDIKNIIEYPSYIDKFKEIVRNILKRLNINRRTETIEDEIDNFSHKIRLRKREEMLARKYLIEQLRARGFKIKEIAEKLNVGRKTIYDTLQMRT